MPQISPPLSELLSNTVNVHSEFAHIFYTVARRQVPPAKNMIYPYPGLMIIGDTLCVCRFGDETNREAYEGGTDAVLRAFGSSKPKLRKLLFGTPFAAEDLRVRDPFVRGLGTKQSLLNASHFEVWSGDAIATRLLSIPPLALHFYPHLIENGEARLQVVMSTRKRYDEEIAKLYGKIQFVGMSVYKEEASGGVDMERIYIPLRVVPEDATGDDAEAPGTNPLTLLEKGRRHVILGDPGSGKSTLLRFLALAGTTHDLMIRYGAPADNRLPLLVTLRRYGDELKSRPKLTLVEYMLGFIQRDLGIAAANLEFLEYFLFARDALVLLDGLDELPAEFKRQVKGRVVEFTNAYPGNSVVLTSRIVGYQKDVRYDNLDFVHHRVARLNHNEVTEFIQNWYHARIENRAERDRHARDLIRIVSAEGNQAIRELATNPLLLTIMSLVHRIDAVLPDERVVLYQKCTETLLNTWHAWKYQGEEERNRNKIERRNRARMEALGYWMHCLLEKVGKNQRSVVPYAEVRKFLTDYIRQEERHGRAGPEQVAEEFLEFVRDRAGLLVEVGERSYSFVHLTFQEYLAATHLRKSGEAGGVDVIWAALQKDRRFADDRWHEVIRLLVGALERGESQKLLLQRILPSSSDPQFVPRALLAGGCLLDNVDGAEELRERIIQDLVEACARAATIDEFRKPLRLLEAWRQRAEENQLSILMAGKEAATHCDSEMVRIGIVLSLLCLGYSDQEVRVMVTSRLHRSGTREASIYGFAFLPEVHAPLTGEQQELHRAAAASFALSDAQGRTVAATLLILHRAAGNGSSALFSVLLSCLSDVRVVFTQFVDALFSAGNLDRQCAVVQAMDVRLMFHRLDLGRPGSRVLIQSHSLARALAGARSPEAVLDRDLDRVLDRDFELARLRASEHLAEMKHLVARERDKHVRSFSNDGELIDVLCDVLSANPRPQWSEAIRLRVLPEVSGRNQITEVSEWERIEKAFQEERAGEAEHWDAACLLLIDIWIYIMEGYRKPDESPLANLAALARQVDSPPLRLAGCIRDMAHGRKSCLEAMLGSDDPTLRRLFVQSYWTEPVRDKARSGKKKWFGS